MNIGVVGLGIIGSRMAANWQKAGHAVLGWNRTPAHASGLGIRLAPTPRALAEQSDAIMIVVADPSALNTVVSGPDGIVHAPLQGKIVFNASTVGASDNQRADSVIRQAGGEFLETPFTGSKAGAEAAKLVFYVGGDSVLFERVEPLLLQVGVKCFHFGPVGAAADAKLIMNMMLANQMQAMVEGFLFARKSGLDMQTFCHAYRLNAGYSPFADMKIPKMLAEDFTTHFALKHMDKDVRLALARAAELGVACPLTDRLKQIFTEAMVAGLAEADFSALYRMAAQKSGFDQVHSRSG